MPTELICPDCGGIIGGDDDDPRPKCTCSSGLSMDDTEVEAQPPPVVAAEAAPPPAAPAGPKKICCICGKDVTHAKRAKDARGYWCYDCHRADKESKRDGGKPRARCPECGRMVPADSILNYHGHTLCAKCRSEQEDLPNHQKLKFKRKVGDDPSHKEAEKRRIMIWGGLVVILLLLALLAKLHFLP
jgi:hypothetical protein